MFAFLHGWRRKLGCVTLVTALLIAGPWLRSYVIVDTFEGAFGPRRHELRSRHGRLTWSAYNPEVVERTWVWRTRPTSRRDAYVAAFTPPVDFNHPWKMRRWEIHYWTLAVPLTLLSVYLVLWRPGSAATRHRRNE